MNRIVVVGDIHGCFDELPVLKSRPWLDLTWPDLARHSPDPAVDDWLRRVERWAVALRSAVPALVAAAYRLAGELSAEQARGHPAARFVFQARDGRLDDAALARQCPTPRKMIQVADALGVAVPGLPG